VLIRSSCILQFRFEMICYLLSEKSRTHHSLSDNSSGRSSPINRLSIILLSRNSSTLQKKKYTTLLHTSGLSISFKFILTALGGPSSSTTVFPPFDPHHQMVSVSFPSRLFLYPCPIPRKPSFLALLNNLSMASKPLSRSSSGGPNESLTKWWQGELKRFRR